MDQIVVCVANIKGFDKPEICEILSIYHRLMPTRDTGNFTPVLTNPNSDLFSMKKSYQWPDFSVIPYEGITNIHFNSDSCMCCNLSQV